MTLGVQGVVTYFYDSSKRVKMFLKTYGLIRVGKIAEFFFKRKRWVKKGITGIRVWV